MYSPTHLPELPAALRLQRRDQGVLQRLRARKALGLPERCNLAHTFLSECSYKRLKLAQLLGQLGVFLTWVRPNSLAPSKY